MYKNIIFVNYNIVEVQIIRIFHLYFEFNKKVD